MIINGFFSNWDWDEVTGRVLQGSLLGQMLFNLFINDLVKGIQGMLIKFVGAIKFGGIANILEDRNKIQKED